MNIPKRSRAVVLVGAGGVEMLALRQVETPEPAPGEVLIRVAAAGVNRADVLQRKGLYTPTPQNAHRPGLEVSGEVAALGDGVSGWKIGDLVVALTDGAGYAEYVAVPAGQVLPLPQSRTLAQGAALPETFFTIQQTLVDRAGISAGMSVLVHGASGGIGATAIQIAKFHGATVIASVSSPEKARYAIELGADHLVAYTKEDFVERVLEVTNRHGADRIIDVVGGETLWRNISAAATNATIIQLGLLGGANAQVNLGPVLSKSLTIIGSVLAPQSSQTKAQIAQNLHRDLWPALADNAIRSQKLQCFALENVAAAHRAMEAESHFGKIALVTDFGDTAK